MHYKTINRKNDETKKWYFTQYHSYLHLMSTYHIGHGTHIRDIPPSNILVEGWCNSKLSTQRRMIRKKLLFPCHGIHVCIPYQLTILDMSPTLETFHPPISWLNACAKSNCWCREWSERNCCLMQYVIHVCPAYWLTKRNMLPTLETSHPPIYWLKALASKNCWHKEWLDKNCCMKKDERTKD